MINLDMSWTNSHLYHFQVEALLNFHMIQECGAPVPGKIVKWAMLKKEIKRLAGSLFLMSRQVFGSICLLKKPHIITK